jgi:energy-coupling factor transporter transmembrane protein EcfT
MGTGSEQPSRVQVLESCALLALVSLVAHQLLHRAFFLYLAILLLAVALFIRPLAGAAVHRWLKFSEGIARVNSTLILFLVFFFVLTPLAFVYRLFNRDPLRLRRDNPASYYVERNHTFSPSDLDKQW